MDFLPDFLQSTQHVIEGSQNIVEEKKIKQKIFREAQEFAQNIANNIKNPDNQNLKEFPQLPLNNDKDMLVYQLVLDFLESIGLKFAPAVFLHETQRTNEPVDRDFIRDTLGLRSYDRTPMLVQLIEEIRNYQDE